MRMRSGVAAGAFAWIALLLSAAAPAETLPGPADAAAIRAVIEDQLAAFRADDAARAFAHASPAIQRKFGTPAFFMEMVRTGYRPVYRPQAYEFRTLGYEGGRLLQRLYVVGPDGRPALAVYEMQRQPDGSWKINGCYLAEAPELGV